MALVYRSDVAQVYEDVLKKNEGQSLKFTVTFFEKPNNIDPTSLRSNFWIQEPNFEKSEYGIRAKIHS